MEAQCDSEGRVLLRGLTREQLTTWLVEELGEKPFRAKQIWSWLYVRMVSSFDEMTDVSKATRALLKERARIDSIEAHEKHVARDGTTKLTWRLDSGAIIESVLIPSAKRNTLCISSQVGCAMNCQFCYTARMGLAQNLNVAEIVDQVVQSRRLLGEDIQLTNIVFMGMGEPFHNPNSVIPATLIMMDRLGLDFSQRRVTVSTSGLVPEIERFGRETRARLAVSLNATTDEVRDWIMPINRRYPLGVLLETLEQYPYRKNERVTLEYVMLRGVNDTREDARRLVSITRRFPSKVNLIPFNPHDGTEFESTRRADIDRFAQILFSQGVSVTVRQTRGDDGMAACGQLGSPGERREPKRMPAPERFREALASWNVGEGS